MPVKNATDLLPRVAGPTLLMSAALLVVCTGLALLLSGQQSRTLEDVNKYMRHRTIARELDEELDDLLASLSDDEDPTHDHIERVQALIVSFKEDLDPGVSLNCMLRLERGFQALVGVHDSPQAELGGVPKTVRMMEVLRREVIPFYRTLRVLINAKVEQAIAAHGGSIGMASAGLLGVGLLGSSTGLVLGFLAARALNRRIQRLSIHVRDAAGLLDGSIDTSIRADGDGLLDLDRLMARVGTEVERVVGELRRREEEVRRADQLALVGRLAAGLAHEVRNPLTLIKLMVQVQREEAEADGRPAGDFQAIEREIGRIERRLQLLLDFARPPRAEPTRLDLAEVVRRCVTLVEGRARVQAVGIEVDSGGPPLPVVADEGQVGQVLANLMINALDVMPRGGRLAVSCRVGAGPSAEVLVDDDGPGIAPEVLPTLGEAFVTGKPNGLGLGLAISRRIAESHGGRLSWSNLPGGGASFRLALPLAGTPGPPADEVATPR